VQSVLPVDAEHVAAVLAQRDAPRERDVPALAEHARLVRDDRADVLLHGLSLETGTPERDRGEFRRADRVLRVVPHLVDGAHSRFLGIFPFFEFLFFSFFA
jgi:hypothetical protein